MDYPENQAREFTVKRLDRCAVAKRAFIIDFAAHNLFGVTRYLETIMGSLQQPKLLMVPVKTKDTRDWFFAFTKDSIWTSGAHDGELGMRLYVNDEKIIEYFDQLCEPAMYHQAIVTLP